MKQGCQACVQPSNLEDQVSVFISPSGWFTQLYVQALSCLFIAFYDLQGYGGNILSLLHMGST
jgi:hypothetical protein